VLIHIVNKTITSLPCQRSVRGNRQADRPVCYGVVVTNGSIYVLVILAAINSNS